VLFVNKRLAYFLYTAGLIVGIARVAGGVHYPSDILGGIILGIIIGFVTYKMWSGIARSN
jgi:undecaprenyl-diphosphatase